MKRIKFLPPFDFLTGNISGAQDLLYPSNNNKAFYSPLGEVNYAENYQPRFIAYQIRQSNKRYFNVRTRTAFHATTRSMTAVSLIGATGAMYASLLNHKSSVAYSDIRNQWLALQAIGMTDSFRQYVMKILRQMIVNKEQTGVFTGPYSTPTTVWNPWAGVQQTTALAVDLAVVAKFWDYLAVDGFSFTIDGAKGICNTDQQFEDVIDGQINVLNLGIREYNNVEYVIYSGRYVLQPNGMYVRPSAYVGNGVAYKTTDINPS